MVRDLKELEKQGVISLPKFGDHQQISNLDGHPTGTRTIYRLPKRETLILTSGYSAVQRAAIIDRWLALEEQAKQGTQCVGFQLPNFLDPAEAAEAWAKEVRAKQALALVVEQQAPAVDFAAAVVGSNGACLIREAAKTLDVAPKFLFSFMQEHGWINAKNEPYQRLVNDGALERKTRSGYTHGGMPYETITTLVTAKGLLRLRMSGRARQAGFPAAGLLPLSRVYRATASPLVCTGRPGRYAPQ